MIFTKNGTTYQIGARWLYIQGPEHGLWHPLLFIGHSMVTGEMVRLAGLV